MRIPQGLIDKNRLVLIRQFLIARNLLRCKSNSELTLAPITTLPSSMPKSLFTTGEASVAPFHKMIDAMTLDVEGLLDIYREIRLEDAFVNSFCEIVQRVYIDGPKVMSKSLRAYVTRNDFITDLGPEADAAADPDASDATTASRSLKQVEINLSSVVGPHTMQELSELHRMLVIPEYRSRLPVNKPRDGLVDYLQIVDDVYRARVGDGQRQCILWVIGAVESNLPEIVVCVEELKAKIAMTSSSDHLSGGTYPKATADKVLDKSTRAGSIGHRRNTTMDSSGTFSPGDIAAADAGDEFAATKVFIVTWDDLVSKMSELKFENQRMYFNPADFLYNSKSYPFEVSVVYFRTGYAPAHYQTQNHWLLREKMEACECAVIPSVVSQLVGLKKAQQIWSSPSYASKYDQIAALVPFFMPQADLNDSDPSTLALIKDAEAHPENYVLKPQREGGGNNIYGQDIKPALQEAANNRGKNSQILMAKIRSPETLTETYSNDKLAVQSCISEIGFYGVACFNGHQQVVNEPIGFLLRTKNAKSDEGGICVDAAVFDSVMLV